MLHALAKLTQFRYYAAPNALKYLGMASFPGSFCQELNLTCGKLLTCPTSIPRALTIKNGLVYELYTTMQCNHFEWEVMKAWLLQLQPEAVDVSLGALRYAVNKVVATRTRLNKNKQKAEQLAAYLSAPFAMPVSKAPHGVGLCSAPTMDTGTCRLGKTQVGSFQKLELEALTSANKSLAKEAQTWRDKYECELQTKEKLQAKYNQFMSGHYNPHNVRRREARKQKQIRNQTKYIRQLERKIARKEVKRARKRVAYFRSKCKALKNKLEISECLSCTELETQLKQLKEEKHDMLEYNASLLDEIHELKQQVSKGKVLETYKDGKYTNELRLCIMELLSLNVGISNVEKAITSVLQLAGVQCGRLPKHSNQ